MTGHNTQRTILLALLLALLLVASTAAARGLSGIEQPCQAGGTSITTEATYADLVTAGCTSDGDIGYTEDTDQYWVCNGATGLWLPPDVQPASIDIVDYTADALPEDSTPAWTSGGTDTQAVSGGELTVTETGGKRNYYLSDADIASANNVGMLVRVKLTSANATPHNWKVFFCLRPGSENMGCVAFASGPTGGLGSTTAITPFPPSQTSTEGYDSPDNQVYRWYLIAWNAATKTYMTWIYGNHLYRIGKIFYVDASFAPGTSIAWFGGRYNQQVTHVWDRVMVFTY